MKIHTHRAKSFSNGNGAIPISFDRATHVKKKAYAVHVDLILNLYQWGYTQSSSSSRPQAQREQAAAASHSTRTLWPIQQQQQSSSQQQAQHPAAAGNEGATHTDGRCRKSTVT